MTRQLLRDRFARYLPSQHRTSISKPTNTTLSDESSLHLLLNLRIDRENDLERARATYQAALPQHSSEPSLDDLVAAGWMRVVWGRISVPYEIAQAVRSESAGTMTAFASLLAKRHDEAYRLNDAARGSLDLGAVVSAIDQGQYGPRDIMCQSPEWVAARLWDRSLTDAVDLSLVLRVWVDRWSQLGWPSLVPARAWNETAANTFRTGAIAVLESAPGLVGWNEMRAELVKQLALTSKQTPAGVEGLVPPLPATLVDRALWLERPMLERAETTTFEACGDLFGLARLLLADIEAEGDSSAPHKIASKLFALAMERPELLLFVRLSVRSTPMLLADMLLCPATSVLACLSVAQWPPSSGAWDRELTTRDDQATKAIAFADAVSVMGAFLQQGTVRPEEVASLLAWIYQNERSAFGNDWMLATLHSELVGQSPETLRSIVSGLTSSVEVSGLGTPRFAASLDIIDAGNLSADVEPEPLINSYIRSVAAGEYTLSANRVSQGGAAALWKLAMRTPSELRRNFLFPIDIKTRVATGVASGENPYTVNDAIARSMRAHIRVLSRAVSTLIESAPDDLVDGLINAVRVGALSHTEKGRVAAFSPRYEAGAPQGGPVDRPIASDLGAALSALPDNHRERLLVAILETDEPMVLAQLLLFVPNVLRSRIERRIADLTPSEAGYIQSLTEAQARIEELLSAGLADAAARFMDAERDLKPLGNVPGRELVRLRATLRLQLLRRDWAAIAKTEPPTNPKLAEHSSAIETVRFYRALAAIKNPAGDTQGAEQALAELQARRPDVAAYAINLLGARIRRLLGNDLFAELDGKPSLRARQVLREAEQMILQARVLSPADLEVFTCNKALLLLALGQPDQVIELLTPLHAIRLTDTIAAYSAVALSRVKRDQEAIATLDRAEEELGPTEILRAARAHIGNRTPFAATVSISLDNDPLPRIRNALWDLSQIDHIRQAEALQPAPDPFDSFVIGHVRSAAASVTALVPMMKHVVIDSCEDDLSAFIGHLLTSRLQFLGWSVPDQSKGGYTAIENAGERDLLLIKDSTVLAVIEAVVCNRPITQEWSRLELTSHFQKLVGYSTCRLFFHLTYAYIDNPASILNHLKQAAEQDAPEGFTYRGLDEIPFTDSRPVGFSARYMGDFGEVKVVFLVLNMGQRRQKNAAKTSAKSNPRTKKSKSKSK